MTKTDNIKSIWQQNNTSNINIAFIGIGLFFIWTLGYSLIVFQQFPIHKIITVSLTFLSILFSLTYLFSRNLLTFKKINIKEVLYAIPLAFIMVLLSSTLPEFAYDFIQYFPLLETELGLGWGDDIVYHVSMIQSMMHFAYPSIGQHGALFSLYHVLSHTVDAFILLLNKLEPYDSYGLLVIYKIWLLISTVSLFIVYTVRSVHSLIYLVTFILISPILTGTWHSIFSHGLWFTTIWIIFSSLKIFTLFQKETLRYKDYLLIFFILVLASLGKISAGLMYASLVGFYLLFKHSKDKQVYLLGFALIIFFSFYIKAFTISYGASVASGYDFSILTPSYIYHTILNYHNTKNIITNYISAQNLIINVSLFISILLIILFRNKNAIYLLMSSLLGYIILIVITSVKTDITTPDIFYFYFGYAYVLTLFLFQCITKTYRNNTRSHTLMLSLLTPVLLYMSTLYVSSPLSLTPKGIQQELSTLNHRPYARLNKVLDTSNALSVKRNILHFNNKSKLVTIHRPLLNFRNSLDMLLDKNHISKKQSLLFIPKSIFEHDFNQLKGPYWARGMLIYAITSIPLVNGIYDNRKNAYAQRDYNSSQLWTNNPDIEQICKLYPMYTIIKTIDIKTPKFHLHRCNK